MLWRLGWGVLLPLSAPAFTTTSLNEVITWSIAGVSDSQILFVNRIGNTDDEQVYYAAPLRPGEKTTISAAITPNQWLNVPGLPDPILCIISANLSLWIPSFASWTYALSPWSSASWPSTPGAMSLVFNEFYTHESADQMLRIHFNGTWMPNPTNAFQFGKIKTINLFVLPLSDLYGYEGVSDVPWLKGWPDYSLFQPALRKPPLGCGLCTKMGLPRFRINTAALNPVIEDIDFASEGVGPGIVLRRTYNADSSVAGRFGRSWSASYESLVDSYANGAIIRQASGRELNFNWSTNTRSYKAPAGVLDTLAWSTNVPGRPGWGAFRLEERATYWTYHYETPLGSESNRPPATNGVMLTRITDLNANTVSLAYAAGRLRTLQDAAGRQSTFQYDGRGFCTNISVPGGGVLRYAYDTNNNLQQSVDLAGNTTVFTYDASGRLTAMDTGGKLWQLQYLSTSMVSAVIDPLGYTRTYQLLDAHLSNRWLIARDELKRASQLWSRNGMSWQEQDPLGYKTTRVFSNGLVVVSTNARGYARRMAYDARNNLIRLTDELGATTSYAHTNFDRVALVSNALGQVWRYSYDSRGNLTSLVQPSGRQRRLTADGRGNPTAETDPAGNTRTNVFDAHGNLIRTTDPLGNPVLFGYDAAGLELTSLTDARGFTTTFLYDANRRRTRTTHPDGTSVQFGYDCCAPTSFTDERGHTWSQTRDLRQNITRSTDPLGHHTDFTYDASRNLVRITNARGAIMGFTYDGRDRRASVSNALGRVVQFGYDALTMTYVQLRPTAFHFFTYDAANRLRTRQIGAGIERYERDALGRLTNAVNARGQQVSTAYDADGRVIAEAHQGVNFATYTYDTNGDLAGMTTARGTTTYARDARRMVTGIRYPDGPGVAFAYDANGNASTLAYPGGTTVSYSYDRRNRVTNMIWAGQSIAFAYDAAGNLLAEFRSNGGSSRYAWDAAGRLTNLSHAIGPTTLIGLRYQRDPLGQVTQTVKTAGILPCVPPLFAATNSAVYNSMDQATAWDGEAGAWDPDGNLTNRAGARPFTAAYDARNRLVSCLRNGTNITCAYDGAGRRTQITAAGQMRHFHHDHRGRLLFETDDAGAVTARYVYRGDALVALWARGKGWHFHHFDATGNALALSDEQGRISAVYRYLPYGAPAGSYARVPNPFTFCGRDGVMDDGDGLYLMGARHYDARLGHFLQRDPLGIAGGFNLYSYARSSPLHYTDPGGLEPKPEEEEYWEMEAVLCSNKKPKRPLDDAAQQRLEELQKKLDDWYTGPPGTRFNNMTKAEAEELAELEGYVFPVPQKLDLEPHHLNEGSADFSNLPIPPSAAPEQEEERAPSSGQPPGGGNE